MIYVQRGRSPRNFKNRAKTWVARYKSEYRHDPTLTISKFWSRIRQQINLDANRLYQVFRGKCAFCESYMAHVSRPHIEHYRPKTLYPDLAFDWNNWLLSCGRCNESKWAHFPDCDGQPCLLDPTHDNPIEHIEFAGYIPVPLTRRGDETIQILGLDRSPLEEERSRWLVYINALICLCLHDEFRSEARELLIWTMQDEAPYAAMTRCYLNQKVPLLAKPLQPHPHVDPTNPIQRIQQLLDRIIPILQNLE